jgi:hypothetical protein
MFKYAQPGCHTMAKCSCSGCGNEQYCGSDCQKLDWKLHKSMCPILKKLSKKSLQSFCEVDRIIKETLALRVLDHLLQHREYQFGKEDTRIGYPKRADGERISNYNA